MLDVIARLGSNILVHFSGSTHIFGYECSDAFNADVATTSETIAAAKYMYVIVCPFDALLLA
jgi:hypothetical protein